MDENMKGNYGQHVFRQDNIKEMHRLELVSKTYDFLTKKQLSKITTRPGMRCLDIGSGSGSIVKWMAEQPNVSEVVAVDQLVDLLEEKFILSDKVKVIQHDINEVMDIEKFDIINVRFVLMHLRERKRILKEISELLKPGGWLVVSDIVAPAEDPEEPAFHQLMSVMWRVLIDSIGTDVNWSKSLKSQFKSSGIVNIQEEVFFPPISRNTPMSEFWYLTLNDLRNHILQGSSLEERVFDEVLTKLKNGEFITLSPGMLTCIGQRRF